MQDPRFVKRTASASSAVPEKPAPLSMVTAVALWQTARREEKYFLASLARAIDGLYSRDALTPRQYQRMMTRILKAEEIVGTLFAMAAHLGYFRDGGGTR